MNIFASHRCPIKSAEYLDDKRVIKMILESAQLISNASDDGPYKRTHYNHPCSIWVRQSKHNAEWLFAHMWTLAYEYKLRYGKTHKTTEHFPLLLSIALSLPDRPFTDPPNCTTYKHIDDVYLAYRLYLNDKWLSDKRPAQCKVFLRKFI